MDWTTTKNSRRNKKVIGSRRNRQRHDSSFYRFLETLGIIDDGWFEFARLLRLTNSDRSRRIALVHFIDGVVQDVAGSDAVEYWDAMEIIVLKDQLFFECFSDVYSCPEQPPRRYHFWSVSWKQGRKLHQATKLVAGECASWRKYQCQRMEDSVYIPWLFCDVDRRQQEVNLAWDVDGLVHYLLMTSTKHSIAAFPDKLTRKIIRFVWRVDPDGFDDAVWRVLDQDPDLRSSLHHLLPAQYSLPTPPDGSAWFTVATLAEALDVSQSTIRRITRQLKMKPVSRRRPWLYTKQHRSEIAEELSKKEARRKAWP